MGHVLVNLLFEDLLILRWGRSGELRIQCSSEFLLGLRAPRVSFDQVPGARDQHLQAGKVDPSAAELIPQLGQPFPGGGSSTKHAFDMAFGDPQEDTSLVVGSFHHCPASEIISSFTVLHCFSDFPVPILQQLSDLPCVSDPGGDFSFPSRCKLWLSGQVGILRGSTGAGGLEPCQPSSNPAAGTPPGTLAPDQQAPGSASVLDSYSCSYSILI